MAGPGGQLGDLPLPRHLLSVP